MMEQLEINLLQEKFLEYSSTVFGLPSFFHALPFLIVGTRSTLSVPTTGDRIFSDYHYWSITHPFLDDDDNQHTSFRAMYRMNHNSLEKLVNDLSQHPVFDLRAHNATPTYIQISCAIWQLANSHIGYRTDQIDFGVPHGIFIKYFRRTIVAIEGVYGHLISWEIPTIVCLTLLGHSMEKCNY